MKVSETYSSCTSTLLKFDLYIPNVIIRDKGIVQIYHDLGEYSDYYEHFAQYLSHEGYVVVVSDFPGHGTSLYNFEQGYFGPGKASETLVEDMHRLRHIITNRYSESAFFMLGVGFGSLVIRRYLAKYGDYVDGVILIGSFLKSKAYYQALSLVKIKTFLHGEMERCATLKKALNTYLQRGIKDHYKTDDQQALAWYLDDPMTDFVYTNLAYLDILDYIRFTSQNENIKKIPDYIPFYLLSGKYDNLVHHGKDTKKLYQLLKDSGKEDVKYKIYAQKRDILHETLRLEVYKDILSWLREHSYL